MTASPKPGFGRIAGGVLAGGASKRMGRDKSLLPFEPDGRNLLQHALSSFNGYVSVLAVAAPAERYSLPAGVASVPDLRPDGGPGAGIEALLRWAQRDGARWLLTRPVDAPHFPVDWFANLLECAEKAKVSSACYTLNETGGESLPRPTNGKGSRAPERSGSSDQEVSGIQPLIAVWRISLAGHVAAYLDSGKRSAEGLHYELGSLIVSVRGSGAPGVLRTLDAPAIERAFANLNSIEDYRRETQDGPATA